MHRTRGALNGLAKLDLEIRARPTRSMTAIHIHLAKSITHLKDSMFRVTRHRLGRAVGHTKSMLTNLDRGIRTANKVFNAVQDVVPDGKLKSAAQRGFSDYEMVRQKVRNSGY